MPRGLSPNGIWLYSFELSRINCRRCLWCNGYRRRKWTRRHEFKSWTRLITFHIALIPLGMVWIHFNLPPAMGNLVEAAWRGCRVSSTFTSCDRTSSSLKGPSHQTLTLLLGARFFVWRMRYLFFKECRRDSRHFWKFPSCPGYDLAPGPALRRALWQNHTFGGTYDK